jgi:LmbE family N-acetylglucosaminyl deacetylase
MDRRRHAIRAGAALLLSLLAWPAGAATQPLLLGEEDRILILAPHPNDETLATGGLIQEALALDLPVRVCIFTMGDNDEIAALFTRRHPVPMPGAPQSLGMRRQNEAIAAATQLGLSTNDLVFLGYPDSGTLDIWNHHWREVPPYRSPLTRANAVPYDRALTPGSAHAGEDILDDLEEVIFGFQPTLLVVPHSADHNVDHRALYLFARVALWHLEPHGIAPVLLPAPVHFTQWPEPRQYHPMRPATPPYFLDGGISWLEFSLAPFQVSNKFAALQRHHSQFRATSACLDSFVRKSELFGDFPDLRLPGGAGSIAIAEDDTSQFQPDADLFQQLSQQSDHWNAIADQSASETAALGGHGNDFTGRSVSGDGDRLTFSFQFSQPLAESLTLVVSLFGYRNDVPFGEMPKIVIELTPERIVAVKDIDSRRPEDSVELLPGGADSIAVRVPLAFLGDPGKILAGAKIFKKSLPVDGVPWRAIDLAPLLLAAPSAPATNPPPASAPAVLPPANEPPPLPGEAVAPARPKVTEALVPRVDLPRNPIPEMTEANEPVRW